jgi:hypothetical protein
MMRDAFIADLEPDLVHRLFLHDGGTSDIAVLATRRVAAAAPARPKLAFISPLPPAKSGIADYSAELLPVLAQHYEIELVPTGDAACAPPLAALFPVRTPGWFAAHADEYDRVLYQIGNSHCHAEMVGLIEQHPGVSSGT